MQGVRTFAVTTALLFVAPVWAQGVYQTPEDFLNQAFAGQVPKPKLLWLTKEMRPTIESILGHAMAVTRVRYWARDGRTAWILEEIGKEEPITVGLIVAQHRIERITVLIFRESRGWEVRYPFFTDQFSGSGLRDDLRLDRDIDGISGASLSVAALSKLARLALYFHRQAEPGP